MKNSPMSLLLLLPLLVLWMEGYLHLLMYLFLLPLVVDGLLPLLPLLVVVLLLLLLLVVVLLLLLVVLHPQGGDLLFPVGGMVTVLEMAREGVAFWRLFVKENSCSIPRLKPLIQILPQSRPKAVLC